MNGFEIEINPLFYLALTKETGVSGFVNSCGTYQHKQR